MSDAPESVSLEELVRARLSTEWKHVCANKIELDPSVPPAVYEAIRRSVNSSTKTYPYVLPTQLLSKLVKPALDCRSLQADSGLPEPFDARTIFHGVIVPFDRANNNVLGGSPEPYVNNPLRITAIIPAAKKAQKDKSGFDDLITVLDFAQQKPKTLLSLVRAVLAAIRDRLSEVSITYPVPNRASLRQATDLLGQFLHDRTGGLRMQAVAAALFRTIGKRFDLFADVRSNNINAADASTGSAAGI